MTEEQTPLAQVWQLPAQSLRVTHPVHWLVVVLHTAAVPVQYLFVVQATQRPLLVSQAGPVRPTQSVSVVHFAHLLAKHRGVIAGQSLSKLQVPGASMGASAGTSMVDSSVATSRAGRSAGESDTLASNCADPPAPPAEAPSVASVVLPPEPPEPIASSISPLPPVP